MASRMSFRASTPRNSMRAEERQNSSSSRVPVNVSKHLRLSNAGAVEEVERGNKTALNRFRSEGGV